MAKRKTKKTDKKHVCDNVDSEGKLCGRPFKSSGGLKTHSRIHEKPKGKKHHPKASKQGVEDSIFIHEDTHMMEDALKEVGEIPKEEPDRQMQQSDIIQATYDQMAVRRDDIQRQIDNITRKALKQAPELWDAYQRNRAAQEENRTILNVLENMVRVMAGEAAVEYDAPIAPPTHTDVEQSNAERKATAAVDSAMKQAVKAPKKRDRHNQDAEDLERLKAANLCVWKDRGPRGWCEQDAIITDPTGQPWCQRHAKAAMGA